MPVIKTLYALLLLFAVTAFSALVLKRSLDRMAKYPYTDEKGCTHYAEGYVEVIRCGDKR